VTQKASQQMKRIEKVVEEMMATSERERRSKVEQCLPLKQNNWYYC